jgi:hypothetical protein
VLLKTIITLNGQEQLTGNDLGSLARSEQRATIERTDVVSVSKASCQSRRLGAADVRQGLVVPSLDALGSIADRLSMSYQE